MDVVCIVYLSFSPYYLKSLSNTCLCIHEGIKLHILKKHLTTTAAVEYISSAPMDAVSWPTLQAALNAKLFSTWI